MSNKVPNPFVEQKALEIAQRLVEENNKPFLGGNNQRIAAFQIILTQELMLMLGYK